MFKNLKIGAKLGIGFGLILAMFAAVGTYAVFHIQEINGAIELVVKDRMEKTRQVNDLIDNTNIVARGVRNIILLEDPVKIKAEQDRLDERIAANTKLFDSLEASIKSEEGKKVLAKTLEARKPYADDRTELRKLIAEGRKAEAAAFLFGHMRETQAAFLKASTELADFQQKLAEADGQRAGDAAKALEQILIGVIVGLIFVSILVAWIISRSLTQPIDRCIAIANQVAKGETDMEIHVDSTNETGMLLAAMRQMTQTINSLMAQLRTMSEEHDKGDIDVVIESAKFEGAYKQMGEGVNKMVLGHIAVKKKAMACISEFGKGNFDAPLEKFPGKKAFINDTIEQVRKNLQALIADANMLSTAAVAGKLSTRADASKHQGDFRKIVQGVNDTLDAVIGPLNVTAKYVDDISKGIIPPTITDNYNGDFNVIKQNLNNVVKMMGDLLQETDTLVKAALNGSLSTRANDRLFVGGWNELVAGVNKTLDSVLEPINEAAGVLDKVAARDMTARVMGNYQGDHAKIKDALNLAVDNLEKALSQVADSTGQVSSASQQIASGSQNLAQGANEQASSLEEVSASLEEMASMTRQNADNALAAKNLANDADGDTRQGLAAMNRMSGAIGKIKESSDQTAKIVKTIDEIAMQTNLLALNAAVEAARAGEAGRGFAVVAEEVRNLAQRSAQAAKNTADMIAESVRNADDGVGIVTSVAQSLDKIAGGVKKVNDLIGEIAAASKEQSQGIKEVTEAVTQMDKVTQQNAANAEESASASEELSSQAEELQSMVAQFKIRGTGQIIGGGQQLPGRKPAAIAHAPAKNGRHEKPGVHLVPASHVIPLDNEVLKEF